jgi:membrane associated rhomboid family serine protease
VTELVIVKQHRIDQQEFTYDYTVLLLPLIFVGAIWGVYLYEYNTGLNFNNFGVYPRSLKGLRGVIFSPFIHSSPKHLFNNTAPLFVLVAALRFFYRKSSLSILFFGSLLTGVFTWMIARPAFHIGASGLIYMLVSFIFFSGVFRQYYKLIAISMLVVFLYGGLIWFIFPTKGNISWEGHLSGFLAGLLFAILFRKKGVQKREFEYKITEFDTYFDEDGNFVPKQVEEENEHELQIGQESP